MEIVEGSYVKIDFGIERDTEFVESIGAIYQGMEGIIERLSDYYDSTPTIILNQESIKKIEEYNLRTGNSWRKDPRIPFRFLFLFPSSNMLKNE